MKKWWGVGGNPVMDLTIFCLNRFFLTLANFFIQRKLKHAIQGEKKSLFTVKQSALTISNGFS